MVDSAAGWKLIKTAPHRDRIDWSPLKKWLHSGEASTLDNDHKTESKVTSSTTGASSRASFMTGGTGTTSWRCCGSDFERRQRAPR